MSGKFMLIRTNKYANKNYTLIFCSAWTSRTQGDYKKDSQPNPGQLCSSSSRGPCSLWQPPSKPHGGSPSPSALSCPLASWHVYLPGHSPDPHKPSTGISIAESISRQVSRTDITVDFPSDLLSFRSKQVDVIETVVNFGDKSFAGEGTLTLKITSMEGWRNTEVPEEMALEGSKVKWRLKILPKIMYNRLKMLSV